MGRIAGSKNKRTIDGGILARDILEQGPGDLEAEDPNPVKQKLKEQARAGVGSQEGLLPAQVFVSLCDRAYGKPVDRIKMTTGNKAYEGKSTDDLAKEAELIAAALRGSKKE